MEEKVSKDGHMVTVVTVTAVCQTDAGTANPALFLQVQY